MKVATVTLNPAVDQRVRVDNFRQSTVNRGQSMHIEASGKGVNVASSLANYGHEVAVTGYLGQENAEIFEQFFAARHIDNHFVRIPGLTRTNIKVVDEVNQQTTDINMPGQAPPLEAMSTLLGTIEQLFASCDWFVLASSLPPGVPTTIYATIITQLKQYGKRVVLDTSGDALREGVQAGPSIVKPNLEELQQLIGHPLTSEAAIEQAARQLLDEGIQLIVVSMGERGALFVDQERTLITIPPVVAAKNTAGAGDAMVAGLISGQLQGLSLADCARLATAFATGAITRIGFDLPTRDTLQMYFHQVSIRT